MRTPVVIVMLSWILVQAAPAMAVADPTPDRIGIYFDNGATQRQIWTAGYSFQSIYIIVTNPTFPAIFGWQAAIRGLDPQSFEVLSTTITGGPSVTGPELQYDVSYESPLVAQPVTILATVSGFLQETNYLNCLVLTGIDHPAVAEMLPLVWTQQDQPSALQIARLYANGVAAAINEGPIPEDPGCANAVAEERTSWGALKSLYRR